MSEPNYHEIEAAVSDLDEQIEALQAAKRGFWKSIRDEHGKKLTDQIKLAVKLNRMDGEKRLERDEIEEGAFRILSILQKPRAPRATRAHTREGREGVYTHDICFADPETGEITEQPEPCDCSEHVRSGEYYHCPKCDAEWFPEEVEQPETANEVPAQDGGGTATGESPSGKSNAARPASVDAHVNDGRLAGEASDEVVTAGETAPHSNPQEPNSSRVKADSPAPSPSLASGTHSDEDIPAFLRKPKTAADYRPHCLHPEACGSSGANGLDHCYLCKKALERESEAA